MSHSESNSLHASHGIVEQWLAEIRSRMPAGATVTATLQLKIPRGFLASFQLKHGEELLSSEARAESVDEAVNQAGQGLCHHLPSLEGLRAGLGKPFAGPLSHAS